MKRKSSPGFSMIESIVAMVIVSIVLGSVYYLVQSQTNSLLYNKKLLNNFFITSSVLDYVAALSRICELNRIIFSSRYQLSTASHNGAETEEYRFGFSPLVDIES